MVSRLSGLETEYATLIVGSDEMDRQDLPASLTVYTALCDAIRRDQPAVAGVFDHEQLFLANGAAVTFESHPTMHSDPGGFLEIATPEVRGPTELLACQRSIDRLASDAAADSTTGFDIRIVKNSSDALGHVYGCHENYEAEVANGFLAAHLSRFYSAAVVHAGSQPRNFAAYHGRYSLRDSCLQVV